MNKPVRSNRQIHIEPNAVLEEVTACISTTYGIAGISLQRLRKTGKDFFEIEQALRSDWIGTPLKMDNYSIPENRLLHSDEVNGFPDLR